MLSDGKITRSNASIKKHLNQNEEELFRNPERQVLPGNTSNGYNALNKSKRVSKEVTDWVAVPSTFSRLKSLLPSPTIFSGLVLKDILEPAATKG